MIQIDMEMPKSCKECSLPHIIVNGNYCYSSCSTGRPDWCPLHEATADPDTVSRRQAIDAIADRCDVEKWDRNPKTEELVWTLEKLPPSPSRPHGHWKFVHPLQEDDPGAYICSECGTGDWKIDPTEDRFCKFCGSDNSEDGEKGGAV